MPDRRLLAACISSSVAGVLLSVLLHSPWSDPNIYSDISSFWARGWVAAGQVPYSQGAFLEYPPVSGLLLYASRIIGGAFAGVAGSSYSGYYVAFSALSLCAAVVMAWSTWRLAGDLGVRVNPLYFLLPSMIIYGVYNFDLFDALFIVLGLQHFVEKKRGRSAVFIGLAIATKFVAGVLVPMFLLELASTKERAKYLAVAGVVAAAFFLPVAILNPGYFSQFAAYFSNWGLEDAWYIWIFGDPFSRPAKLFGLAVLLVLLARTYTLRMPLPQRSFLAISAYLLGTYIYAPQFNLTLIPLVAVLALTSPWLYFWEVFDALIILTWFSVPATPTSGPTYAWTLPQAFALLRSASLALLSLSVASGSGHSLYGWLVGKVGAAPAGRVATERSSSSQGPASPGAKLSPRIDGSGAESRSAADPKI